MTTPTVEVTAVGRASCVPDRVSVRLAVEVTTPAVGTSVREASRSVETLLALLDAQAMTDRRTVGLSVEQRWDPATNRPNGHTAVYALLVVVDDLDAAGRLVQQAGDAVGDMLRVHGFELSVADPSAQQEQARRAAVAGCRAQAGQLAEAAGLPLGALVRLSEGGGALQHGIHLESGRAMSGGMPVQAGQLEVAVAVSAVYRLGSPPG